MVCPWPIGKGRFGRRKPPGRRERTRGAAPRQDGHHPLVEGRLADLGAGFASDGGDVLHHAAALGREVLAGRGLDRGKVSRREVAMTPRTRNATPASAPLLRRLEGAPGVLVAPIQSAFDRRIRPQLPR
jgi:hypothetical protein